MGRASVKENKGIYQLVRENLKLTREGASQVLNGISPERIEKIENERAQIIPWEVLEMSRGYKAPHLCNQYCAKECPIGQTYVPEIEVKDLTRIVMEMLSSLNSVEKRKERLIEIAADDMISGDEIKDFVAIQEELERISLTVETLQLWSEQMLADGTIDRGEYEKHKRK